MRTKDTRPKLSAAIITYNEEDQLERCLKSVQWMDEIVVVDSGSKDRTREIASRYTDRVVYRKFDNYASQRNHASALASHDWIFYIDADEEVTGKLRHEIERTLSEGPEYSMYAIPRKNIYFGKSVRYVFGDDRPIRLYNKEHGYLKGAIHEKVVGGSAGSVVASLWHYGPKRYADWISKHRKYTRLEAREHFQNGRRFSFLRLCLSPLKVFFFRFFRLQGWRDGKSGFLIAMEMARSTLIYQFELLRLEKIFNRSTCIFQ